MVLTPTGSCETEVFISLRSPVPRSLTSRPVIIQWLNFGKCNCPTLCKTACKRLMAQAANAIDVRLFFAALAVGRTMYFHDVKEIQNYIFVQPDVIKTMQYAITFRYISTPG